MIELQKKDLLELCLSIAGFNNEGVLYKGLMIEELPLSFKRRARKIHTALIAEYHQYNTDLAECKTQEEIDVLNSEVVKIDSEKLSIDMFDSITTKQVFNFELLEKTILE